MIVDHSEIGQGLVNACEAYSGQQIEGKQHWDSEDYSFLFRSTSETVKELNIAVFVPTIETLLDSVIPDYVKRVPSVGGSCAVLPFVEPSLAEKIEARFGEVQPPPVEA